ncbi:MAG: GNAT family N-acetyltransferase [Candidatus Nanopelagicales bacterium]
MDLRLEHEAETSRYLAWPTDGSSDEPVGVMTYVDQDGVRDLNATVVPTEWEGRGIASRLARFAIDDIRASGLMLVPGCPFVRAFLERHPQDLDLVPAGRREEFGL